MITEAFRRSLSILVAVLALAATAAAQQRPITETDLLKFVWTGDPQISPDGSLVAFVRVAVDEKKDRYDTTLWIASAAGGEPPRQLTNGVRDASPRWSPDSTRLAFTRVVEKDGKPQPPQIYVLAMAGGEARPVTEIPRGAGNPVWSPDGKLLAFSSSARPDELDNPAAKEDEAKEDEAKKKEEQKRESDVRVITEAVYRANGVADFGYLDRDRPSHIWTTSLPGPGEAPAKPTRITSGEFGASNFQWSADGSQIYFVSNRQKEAYHYPFDSDLYAVSNDGGEPERLVSIDGPIGAYAISPDGNWLAFVGTFRGDPERSYSQSDLWVVNLPAGTPRNLTDKYDFDMNGGLSGDQRAPRGSHPAGPVWSQDGRSLIIKVGEHGNANLKRIDVTTGKIADLTTGDQEVVSYTADKTHGRLAFVRSTPTVIGDLYVLDTAAAKSPRKLTSFNDALFGELTMNEPEEFWYTSFDGLKIQGWILKPPGFDTSKKYPMILQIHGGPHAAYGNTFTHEFQWMAARDYVVVYTNPRGSSNYGQEFGNSIQFAYPGDDYKDLMAGVDEILKRGYIDETRLGVTGGSGGGLLTNWVVTQTNRFKGAVSQRDISDWSNFWYTADFTLFRPTWFRKPPFEDPADFARRSPITHVANIQTPLMFILGDEDWRTPPAAGGEELFRALKYLKRPTVMIRFPDENHELSRSGKPWHRVERLQHIVNWFDKWLNGRDVETYDVARVR